MDKIVFEASYRDLIDGSWPQKWNAAQAPYLPKHRISHVHNDLRCTCGAGPFESMELWSKHACNLDY